MSADLGQSGGRSTPGKDEGIKGVPQPSSPPLSRSVCPECGCKLTNQHHPICSQMTAERALVLIHQNCVALANDDDSEVKAARALAIRLAGEDE